MKKTGVLPGKPSRSADHTISPYSDLAEKINDSNIDRIMAIDLDWNIISWNKTCEAHTGFLKKEVLDKNLLEVFPGLSDDKEMMTAITEAFKGRKSLVPSSPDLLNRHYIENHFVPLLDDDNSIFGVMNIMHDVAHRIKVEKQLLKLNSSLEKKYRQVEQANFNLSALTYITGADIQEPIKHIYTSLELMARKEGNNLSNSGRGNLRKIQAQINRMNLLLDDILEISRVSNAKMQFEAVDLNIILQQVQAAMEKKIISRNVTITAEKLPEIYGSPEGMNRLFHHLLDNAIKFQLPENPPVINITYRFIEASESYNQYAEVHEISFGDNGLGFRQEDSERIFNMFEKLHEDIFRSSGIGLAACQIIMNAHNGSISAESEPGKGSTFHCRFPVGL